MMRVVLGKESLRKEEEEKGTKRERKWLLFYIYTQCRERLRGSYYLKKHGGFFHVVVRKRFYRRRLLFVPPLLDYYVDTHKIKNIFTPIKCWRMWFPMSSDTRAKISVTSVILSKFKSLTSGPFHDFSSVFFAIQVRDCAQWNYTKDEDPYIVSLYSLPYLRLWRSFLFTGTEECLLKKKRNWGRMKQKTAWPENMNKKQGLICEQLNTWENH